MADDDQMTRQRYRQQQSQSQPSEPTEEEPADSGTEGSSRQAYAAENIRALEEVKTKRMARKLNWVIAGLVLGIIIVFLILFFTP
ncbi:hypothetical protein [Lactiplantibacillus herbarum]|uniref:hypothetical protein n=1 Tax=Lactiplantibacillus herbarum TaxID=1670446 RepID=UPI00064F8137|nr:hypothetical protein [Lactiplantibacillus herbarum]